MKQLIATILIITILAPAALFAQPLPAPALPTGGLRPGVTVLIANGSRPTPRYVPEEVDAMNYRNGYSDEARRKNMRSAAIPGVIMSTLWTLLVLSAASQ